MKVCYRLADLAEIGRGSSPRPITDQRYFENGDIPWIKIADATASGKYIYETKEHVNEYGASFSRKLKPESLIIAASGTLGFPKFLGVEGCIHDGWMYFSDIDESLITKDYLYYYLITLTGYFNNLSYGAAIQNINTPIVKKTKVFLPPLDVQAKISNALSTYDELIENNNKRIKLLEQMAENLYKEWFVRFRFPKHESTKFENGIPKTWETKRLGDELTIKRGGSPRPIQDFITENGLKWLKISDATKTDNPFIFNIEESIKEEGLKKTVYRKAGSLVLSNSATPGLPRILALDTCIHDGWLYFENQKLSNEFLFLFFSHIRPQLVNKGNGAVFTNLKTDILKKYFFVRPTDDILSQFDEIVQPLFKQIYSITQQNNNLIKQRDLLLPRLMSGKLEV